MTIRDQIVAARARLIAAQIAPDEAARDAALLARHALGWDAASLARSRARIPRPPVSTSAFERLVARRERREPVAYIRGVQEFWGREFAVHPGVLIPRPETELIVEEALRRAARDVVETACDVGTGSGCLAVTLAAELPRLRDRRDRRVAGCPGRRSRQRRTLRRQRPDRVPARRVSGRRVGPSRPDRLEPSVHRRERLRVAAAGSARIRALRSACSPARTVCATFASWSVSHGRPFAAAAC